MVINRRDSLAGKNGGESDVAEDEILKAVRWVISYNYREKICLFRAVTPLKYSYDVYLWTACRIY